MAALVVVIAMHSVRIDHQFELLLSLMQFIDKEKGVLMMNIVVSGAMSQLQHHVITILETIIIKNARFA